MICSVGIMQRKLKPQFVCLTYKLRFFVLLELKFSKLSVCNFGSKVLQFVAVFQAFSVL